MRIAPVVLVELGIRIAEYISKRRAAGAGRRRARRMRRIARRLARLEARAMLDDRTRAELAQVLLDLARELGEGRGGSISTESLADRSPLSRTSRRN